MRERRYRGRGGDGGPRALQFTGPEGHDHRYNEEKIKEEGLMATERPDASNDQTGGEDGLIERTPSAYSYPLLIKHLLHTPLAHAPEQEIVYRDLHRYDYRALRRRMGAPARGG